jgi:ABC-2 type transport system ATP-binding protein
MDNPAIRTAGLTKCFNNTAAVKELSLEIGRGEIFAFLGPNGAGKTTTIKLLAGLLKQTSGEVFICGHSVAADPVLTKRMIGLMPDRPFIYPKLTGFEFLRFIGDIYGVDARTQSRRIPELLTMFELSGSGHELIESYSLGMRQKLVFASILLHQPRVLLLDEPLIGLDPKTTKLVKDIFMELKKRNVTIFLSTHIIDVAEKLADRIGIINKGELIVLDDTEHLRARAKEKLEDVYLELTGGTEYAEMLKYL